ncbi:monocarboxylate transporter 11-like [Diadema antillarum]|uniref:monocarboxylate transporter 11-like n=1 Tax=Diadema antillarum TaxID=105358 RepID=UPI003A8B79DD
MLIGGPVLSSLGFALASLTANYAQFTACMGLTGFGFSFMLMCMQLELSEQAGTHFGLCLGIGMAGFAVGMAIIPLLGEFLMTIYGWRGAMLILGGLMGNITPMTAAIVPKVPASSRGNVERKERGTKEEIPFGMSYGAWHSFLIPRAAESGLAIFHVILVSVCVAVANMTGRIVVGLAAEKFRRPHEIHLTLTFMNATFVLCDVLIFRSTAIFRTAAIFVTSFLSSFAMAGREILVVILSRCLASADHRFIAMGIGEFNVGLGSLAGAFIAGFMADRFSGFNLSFAMVVGFEIPVFLLVLLSKLKKETP